jgi:hypothetical protein
MAKLPLPPWGFSGLHWLLLGRPVGCAEKGIDGLRPKQRKGRGISPHFPKSVFYFVSKFFWLIINMFETSNFLNLFKITMDFYTKHKCNVF